MNPNLIRIVGGLTIATLVLTAAMLALRDRSPTPRPGNVGLGLSDSDCFVQSETGPGSLAVRVVSCTEPHDGQVISTKRHSRDADYRGGGVLFEALAECAADFEEFVGRPALGTSIGVDALSVNEEAWPESDKSVFCVAVSHFGDISYDLKDAGR